MLLRPDRADLQIVGLWAARAVSAVGVALLVPAAYGLAVGERAAALSFVIAACLALIVGRGAEPFLAVRAEMNSSHALAAAAVALLLAPVFAAVPLLASGHYGSFMDAYFEALSGFAAVGLSTVNDLDHLARSVNLWRHLMQLVGAQAFVVLSVALFTSGARVGTIHTASDREERVLPNARIAARGVLPIMLTWVVAGVVGLGVALLAAGVPWRAAMEHAVLLMTSAFHTGGFAPTAAGVGAYRSPVVEAVLIVLMVAGASSVLLHARLRQSRRREALRHLELRTAIISLVGLFALLAVGLGRTGTFDEPADLVRHGFFQLVSAHTTTGLTTVSGRVWLSDWGVLAPAMLVTAMAIGGMAGSAAGGIKTIRIGLMGKGLRRDIRKVLLPESAQLVETYYAPARRILASAQVRDAATLLLLYLMAYLAGGIIALFYDYGLDAALFESTSAASGGGLSVGVVRPALEWPLKLVYIGQMLLGRLEFTAIFALAGYLVATFKGRA